MAGAGAKKFPAFSKLASDDVNNYLADQVIMRFATTTARDAAFGGVGEPTLAEGMTAYIDADNTIYTYDGSNWIKMVSAAQPNGLWRMSPTVSGSGVSISNGTIIATNATEAIVENCFSSEFDFYRLMLRYQTSTTNNIFMQLRTAGGSNANTDYNYSEIQGYLGFGVTVSRPTGQAQMQIGTPSNGAYWSSSVIDIFAPSLNEPTTWNNLHTRSDANYANAASYLYNGNHSTATAYPSCRIFVSSGTFTAKFALYGYRN
jgi:hypothetical protein